MPAKTTASKTTTSKKVTVRKASTAKKATTKAPKTAAKKTAAKSTWVTQSSVGFSEEIGASRFTTQTQRRLLREIVKAPVSFTDAKPATLRSLDRLKDLGLVTVAKNGTAKATARGAALVA